MENYDKIMCKRLIVSVLATAFSFALYAGDTVRYNLTDCRAMALENSASARIQQESLLAAKYNRQAAFAAMFPRLSANGGYMWNQRNAHLVDDEFVLPFGTATLSKDGQNTFAWNANSRMQELVNTTQGTIFEQPVKDVQTSLGQGISGAYRKVYEALTLDVHHLWMGQVGIIQPIYTGGRLSQMYKISKIAEHIAAINANSKHDDIIFKVDEAYWRVVSVAHKKQLAYQYYQLLVKLENDVTEAVNEGMATQSDLLKVKTKRGEAEVKRLQADNGLVLSRMALAQVCGLPLYQVFDIDDSGLTETRLPIDSMDTEAIVASRSEMQLVEEMAKMAKQSAKLASAGLQPNIVAAVNYTYTNPNAENGIYNDWRGYGSFNAGVIVNIPIAHADAILRYKAAKHSAKVAELKAEETRELLTLQTTQANQQLMEAQQKIALARLTLNNAEEVLRMAEESFHAGMITTSDLMAAQTSWLSAAGDVIDAEVEAKTTETKLRKYMGKL